MGEAAEIISTTETISRRTDDILYDVRYLAENIVDRERRLFTPGVEEDVVQQSFTGVAESDIHKLGAKVTQQLDPERGQYVALGSGTVDNAITGLLALDMDDPGNYFEFDRRVEEVTEEVLSLEPKINEGMRAGGIKLLASPSPTHHEVDPEVALSHDYDDRSMFRMQSMPPDGLTKEMTSYSVFDVPASAWAAFFSDRYGEIVEPTALAVMQFCHRISLEFGSPSEVLQTFIGGVIKYLPEDGQQSVQAQLDAFLTEQAELEAQAMFYAQEKLAIKKELACSLNDWASPVIAELVRTVRDRLNPTEKMKLSQRFVNGNLFVDEYVATLVSKIKTVTTANRAGLATLNERTIKRFASKVGLEATIQLAQQEQLIQQAALTNIDSTFMIRRNEQLIAEAGVGCGGGCEVQVVDLFSSEAEAAEEAGLSGTLYEAKSLNQNSKCSCKKKARVISDGSNVICVGCWEFEVKGKRGKLTKKAA